MHSTNRYAWFLGSILLVTSATQASPLLWQDNSLSYLYGDNYAVNPPIQQTLTLEHTSGWSIGDLYGFVDQVFYNGSSDPTNGNSSYYGEIAPRLSFAKLFNQPLSFAGINDVLLASTYEFGENPSGTNAFLLGIGLDLNIPGFEFFHVNIYHRDPSDGRDGQGVWQITPVWGYDIPIGNSFLRIDGYIDAVVDNDKSYHANLHINPQIKYDVGQSLGYSAKKFYFGIEYDYWESKYGIKSSDYFDTNQNTFSALVQLHW